jgi:Fe-S-cluster-containing dehydrogenase component/CRP-like cAMP-binding protein
MSHPRRDELLTVMQAHSLPIREIGAVLEELPFFATIPQMKLEDLARRSFLRRFEAGQKVLTQGEHGHTLLVLMSGGARVEVMTDTGQLISLGTFDAPGCVFGEMSVLGRTRRSGTVIATAVSLFLEIEKARLEALDRDAGGAGLMERLERFAERRAIQSFIAQHQLFARLDPRHADLLVDHAALEVHARGEEVFRQGDRADSVWVIKSGVAKLQRSTADALSVLAYFNSGDVVGLSEPESFSGTLISTGFVETIRIPRRQFAEIEKVQPELLEHFRKSELSPDARIRSVAVGERDPKNAGTILAFVDELVKEGAQEAQSLLTIDLDLCVRCGNCVRACEARHGRARMTRRGKQLVRRRHLEDAGDRQTLLLPSSCRHCASPECMIGCPTGAIHRKPTGEVDIHDFCIGCSNCAIRCPWGNITMAPTPGRIVEFEGVLEERAQIASKCTLCAGYDNANCVDNCPTGAIMRVEPTTFFPEVERVLGTGDKLAVGGARTADAPFGGRSRAVAPIAAISLLALLVALHGIAPRPFATRSPIGFALGITALAMILGALALAGRRRMNRFRTQLGTFETWTRAHVHIGLVGFGAALLHADFRAASLLTAMLLLSFALMVATGLFGAAFYKWMPRVITRLEGESQVEEDLVEERRAIRRRRANVLAGTPEGRALIEKAQASAGSLLGRYLRTHDRGRAASAALDAIVIGARALSRDQQREIEGLVHDAVREREIAAALVLYRIRMGWLITHVGVATALVVLVLVHIASVLYY